MSIKSACLVSKRDSLVMQAGSTVAADGVELAPTGSKA